MAATQPALEASPIRLRALLFPTFALLLAVLAAACGGGDDEGPSPSPVSPAPSSTRTETAAPTPTIGEAEFDSSRALELVRALSVDIGIRAAGTEGETRAANFIRDELAKYGYDTKLQPFPIETFVDVNTSLELLAPEQRVVEAFALGRSASASLEGALLPAGLGFPQQFPTGTDGSIVLIERGEITFGEKVANATAAGAAGVVIYNNQSGPFRGSLTEESRIPAASISREDGLALVEPAQAGQATGRLTIETRVETGESRNVVAEPPGGACRLVIGGHYDSVPAGPGANDNASGTAVVIELARAMAADGSLDNTCFVLFGSEEIGLVGSAHYVASLSDAEAGAMEAMLNFDMLGVGNGWPFTGSRSVVEVASQRAEELSILHSTGGSDPGGGSDHASFIDAGIPAMLFNCFCDPNYHTADDRFEHIEKERLAQAGALGMATAQALLAG